MQQYNTIKSKYPDALLLFRVGDFYETFGEDAIKAAKILVLSWPKEELVLYPKQNSQGFHTIRLTPIYQN